ncbi:MAG: dihydrofolate reductase family protein [Treponema sp.]|nr:dihydrofolate reductase family protein [Treponema sp.]
MPKLVVRCFAVSMDGFSAGPNQRLEEPFGDGAMRIMNWFKPTKTYCAMVGLSGGEVGLDNDFAAKADDNIGATIMGRHMFGPDRGPWDRNWRGWWGDNPPYHHPVFVLCHQDRESFALQGGTDFTFVTNGIEAALHQAFVAAKGKDVRIGGGPDTVRQYLKAGLIDELHLVQVPFLLGHGEPLFQGLDGVEDRYECVEFQASKAASHLKIVRKGS